MITTLQPCSIMPAMCTQVSRVALNWSGTVRCCLSLIRELPPIATTATFPSMRFSFHILPIVKAMIAFCTCRRFSAMSTMIERGPLATSSVTSFPRSTGMGWMK